MGGHHRDHGSDVGVVAVAAVARVEAADYFCGKGGFAAAGDAGDAD